MRNILTAASTLLKYAVILVFFFGASALQAQPKTEAPAAVIKALQAQYTGTEDLTWKPKAKKTWLAEFDLDGQSYTSRYAEDGKWIETEQKVKTKDLPEAIRASVNSTQVGWEIQRGRFVTSPTDAYYVVFIENDADDTRSLRFDESGKAIEKVKSE